LKVAHGQDERAVVTSSETKSISRETTFERDLHARQDRELLSQIFTDLCMRLAGDLKRKGYLTHKIGIKLRYTDFRIVSRDITLPHPTADHTVIRRAAGECLRRAPLEQKLRLLGVRASALTRSAEAPDMRPGVQGDLFDC
jgi:DNA polymerase-4